MRFVQAFVFFRRQFLSLSGLALMLFVPVSRAEVFELAKRLPSETNAFMAVDIEKIMASDLAKAENWADARAANWAKRPLMIPPEATHVVMASHVDPTTMQSTWEISMMDVKRMAKLENMAQLYQGVPDRLWDKMVIQTPMNAYLAPLDPKTLAVISPAQRQFAVRWIRQVGENKTTVDSEYLAPLITGLATNTSCILMAIDMEGAWSLPKIRRALDVNEIEGMPSGIDLDEVARVIGSIRGITLRIDVTDTITGSVVVDFGRECGIINPFAKPLVQAVLTNYGIQMPALKKLRLTAMGKQMKAEGPLETGAMSRIASIINSTIPVDTGVDMPTSTGTAESADNAKAQASLKYYKMVCGAIDNLTQGPSLEATGEWLGRASKRVGSLPIYNVDPELVAWGNDVSLKMLQASQILTIGSIQTYAKVQGVATPAGEWNTVSTYGSGYNWGYGADVEYRTAPTRTEYDNVYRQRRQAAAQQKAESMQQVSGLVQEVKSSRMQIRTTMTQKYNMEF